VGAAPVAALGLVAALAACDRAAPPAPPPAKVLVVPVVRRDVPLVSEWIGTTEGSVDAQIHAQVAGNLVARTYEEGQRVDAGDLLFRIDPRPFQAALDQARSQLRQAEAQRERSHLDVARDTPLLKDGAVSRQEYDNAVQGLAANEAAAEAARAAAQKAEIDLGFTEIRSPIRGIAGVALRQVGDFVGPNDPQPLTSVSTLDPIRVAFQLSEQEYMHFLPRFQQAIERRSFRKDALQLVLADGSIYPHLGTGYPAGREVDPHTGTITVKGIFPNPGDGLRPGQYARVRVATDLLPGALVVPERAVQDLQGGSQLSVVGADGKVEVRSVTKGPLWGTLQVISQGVAEGDRVIVEGFQKVRSGTLVDAQPAPAGLGGSPPAQPPPPPPAIGAASTMAAPAPLAKGEP